MGDDVMNKKNNKLMIRELFLILIIIFLVLVMTGISMNFVAITNNNCKMPVKSDFEYEKVTHKYFINKEDINYFYLVDIFPIKFGKHIIIASLGDFLITLGIIGSITFTSFYTIKVKRDIKKR